MPMTVQPGLRGDLAAHRGDDEGDWLLATLRWLDLRAGDGDIGRLLNQQASAALICAAAPELALRWPAARIENTRQAAAAWLRQPDEERWGQVFSAASASYPFGPGEGCHAVEELGGHGAPGSGCSSGIGWAWSLGNELGAARVRALWEPVLMRLAGDRPEPIDDALGPIEVLAATDDRSVMSRRRIGRAVWALRDVSLGRDPNAAEGPRYRVNEVAGALPSGSALPTRWQWLELLRAVGVEIVSGPWEAAVHPLWEDSDLAFAARRPARPQSPHRTAWWMRSFDGPEDLFVLHETRNRYHFTFSCSRPGERALVRPTWPPGPRRAPEAASLQADLEELEPSRVWVDSRDDRLYRVVTVAGRLWMADSLRWEVPGSVSLPHRIPANGGVPGRYYARQQLAQACPAGWRVPTQADWQMLLRRFGGLSSDAHATPAELLMALAPGGHSGLDLLAQGHAESWMSDLEPQVLADCEPAEQGPLATTLWSAEGAIFLTAEQAWPFDPTPWSGEWLRPLRCVRDLPAGDG